MLRFIMTECSYDRPVYLPWDQLSFDSAPSDPNRKMQFFVDAPSTAADRVTTLDKKTLVRWLMRCERARAFIFRKLGREPSAFYATELIEPFYDHGKGDVDLLLCDRLDPAAAVALECKRIKVEGVDVKNDHMNKLPDTALAVQQANKLYEKCGFLETHLALLIAIDSSSKQLDSNIPCRGLRPGSTRDFGDTKTQRAILNFPGHEDLNTKIGIIFIEVVQPSGKPLDEMATVRVLIFHPAKPRLQSAFATSQLRALIERARSVASWSDAASWVGENLGTVEFRIGDGADAPRVGMSSTKPQATPALPTSLFTLRNWKTVLRRNPR